MKILLVLKFLLIAFPLWIKILQLERIDEAARFPEIQKNTQRILKFLGFPLTSEGVENIPENEPVLFISNHQGTIDPLLVVASSKITMAFVSKAENEKIPFFGRGAKLLGTIHFDRNSREGNIFMLREGVRRLKSGKSLLIFPEGTRSKGDDMNKFNHGAFQLALMSKATIVPVTLNNAHCFDHQSKDRNLKVSYGKAIPYAQYKELSTTEISDLVYDIVASKIERK